MIIFWSFQLKPNEPYKLSSLPEFYNFHLTTVTLSNPKKQANLFAIIDKQKYLIATVNSHFILHNLDLRFHRSQKCEFIAEGGAEITVLGYYTTLKKEKSIDDEDEFKAIAFKANKISQELEELHKKKKH